MVYEYEVTKEVSDALIDATLLTPVGVKQLRMYRIRCLIVALLFICLIPLVNNFIFTIMMLIAAAFIILFTIFATRRVLKNSIKKAQSKLDQSVISGFRRYTFSEDKVITESSVGKSEFEWKAFLNYMEYKNYIFIALNDGRKLAIDKNKVSENELADFYELLKSKLKRIYY